MSQPGAVIPFFRIESKLPTIEWSNNLTLTHVAVYTAGKIDTSDCKMVKFVDFDTGVIDCSKITHGGEHISVTILNDGQCTVLIATVTERDGTVRKYVDRSKATTLTTRCRTLFGQPKPPVREPSQNYLNLRRDWKSKRKS